MWIDSLTWAQEPGKEGDWDGDLVYIQGFHHGNFRGEANVDKTMYMKSIVKCCSIPFVLCLPLPVSVPILCSFSRLSSCSPQRIVKSVFSQCGGRVEPELLLL